MPDQTNARSAAEEMHGKVFEMLHCYSDGVIYDCDCSKPCILTAGDAADLFEAIIDRHCGEAERALRQRIDALENACKEAYHAIDTFSIPMPFYSATDHLSGLRSAYKTLAKALGKRILEV